MTLDEARNWIAEIFEEPVENIQPDTPRDSIPAWDSLGMLTLMASLDENFGILMTDEEMQNLRSVEDLLQVLRSNGKIS